MLLKFKISITIYKKINHRRSYHECVELGAFLCSKMRDQLGCLIIITVIGKNCFDRWSNKQTDTWTPKSSYKVISVWDMEF